MKFFGSVEPAEEEDVTRGRDQCGGYSITQIGLYPILTDIEYKWTVLKFLVFITISFFTPFHLASLRWALKAHEVHISLENASFFLILTIYNTIFFICLRRRELIKGMFRKVGSGFFTYQEPMTDEQQNIIDNQQRSQFLYRLNHNISISGSLVYFLTVPVLKVIQSGSWSTESDDPNSYPNNKNLPVRINFGYTTDTATKYILTYAILMFLSTFGAMIVQAPATLFLGFSIQICNQLKILNLSLRNIRARAVYLYTKRGLTVRDDDMDSNEFRECLAECLKENVHHHLEIIRLFQSIFSKWTFFQLVLSGTVISLTAYSILQVDTSQSFLTTIAESGGRLLILSLNILHATIFCLGGQVIANASEDITQALYSADWENNGRVEFRRSLLICLAYSENPWVIKGYGIIPAGAETLVGILKTAFSLLNFIHFVVG